MTQAVTSATAPHVGLTRVWVDDGTGDLGARVLRRISSADDVDQGDSSDSTVLVWLGAHDIDARAERRRSEEHTSELQSH